MQPPRRKNKPPRNRLPDDLINFAREMRSEPTHAEARLWRLLRRKQLGGFRFRRQHAIRGYILDFYCPEAKLAIELDGGQHAEDDERVAHDDRRDQFLVAAGIRVLRFWDTDGVLEAIWDALHEERPRPERKRIE